VISGRDGVFSVVVTAFGAVCFVGGRMGDVSMRDPLAIAVVLAMIVGWLAALWFGSAQGKRGGE
jgi:hypothetical protein